MRSVAAALLLLALVGGGSAGWLKLDRAGTALPEDVLCQPDPSRPHLRLVPDEPRFETGAPYAELGLLVVNPTDEPFRFWGAPVEGQRYAVRWDGRLAAMEAFRIDAGFAAGYEGTEVPPGESWWHAGVQARADAPGAYVMVVRMDGMCASSRYVVG